MKILLTILLGWLAVAGANTVELEFDQLGFGDGSHLYYAQLEGHERSEVKAHKGRAPDVRRALRLADARMDFLLHRPDDFRCWLVAAYWFLPPLPFSMEERVAYVNAADARMRSALAGNALDEKNRLLLMVVDAAHQLDVLQYERYWQMLVGRIEKPDFGKFESRLQALTMRFPGNSSVQRLQGYAAELRTALETPMEVKERTSPPSAADIDWLAIDQGLELRWPWPLAELHARAGAAESTDGAAIAISLLLQDRSMRDGRLIAQAFYTRYPQDPRVGRAIEMYLFPEPDFQAAYPDPRSSERLRANAVYMKSLPDDTAAREQWARTGEAMVAAHLASTYFTPQDKERVARRLIYRDVRHAFGMDWRGGPRYIDWPQIHENMLQHLKAHSDVDIPEAMVRGYLYILNWHQRSDQVDEFVRRLQSWPDARAAQAAAAFVEEQAKLVAARTSKDPVELKFTAVDGREVDIAGLRGKVVLLDFWATWCKPCVEQLPHIKALYEEYRSQGFEVIGISGDSGSRARLLRFIEQGGYGWPHHFDGKGTVNEYALKFGVRAWPTTYLLDKEGRIAETNLHGERLRAAVRKQLGLE